MPNALGLRRKATKLDAAPITRWLNVNASDLIGCQAAPEIIQATQIQKAASQACATRSMNNLTPKQIEVLRNTGHVRGTRFSDPEYRITWKLHGQVVTRAAKPLIGGGLVTAYNIPDQTAAMNITDAGRQALIEATSGRVRLDKAVEGMVAAMKLYRNHAGSDADAGESTGYYWFTSQSAAIEASKQPGFVPWNRQQDQIAVPFEIQLTRAGVLDFLNRWASHPNNG